MNQIQSSIGDMQRAIDLINLYNCHNILCDFRGLNVDFTIITAINRPKMWNQLGLPQAIKIAGLFDKIDGAIEMQGNTIFSSGFHVTLYTNYDKAIKWLSETQLFKKSKRATSTQFRKR